MDKKLKNNIIWIDFKTKRAYDLSKFGRPEKTKITLPYLCMTSKQKERKNGSN